MPYISHPLIKPETIERRDYQEILTQRTLEQGNTLVVAPTALGKTIVAILLTAEKYPQGKVIFLSPTKPLAKQHYQSFIKFLNIPEEEILLLTGEQTKERKEIFQKARVISATPQTLEKMILKGIADFQSTSLLIFDESHRAVGSYAYVYLAKAYNQQNPNGLILALTASPGSTKEKIEEVCQNLNIKNIEIKKYSDEDVKPYIKDIDLEWVSVSLPKEINQIKDKIKEFVSEQTTRLSQITNIPEKHFLRKKNLLDMQSRLMRQKNKHPSSYTTISILAAVVKIEHALTLLETQGIPPFKKYIEKLKKDKTKAAAKIFSSEKIKDALSLMENLEEKAEHPKIETLRKIIMEQLKDNNNSKIIVFCNYRDSISNIVEHLRKTNINAKEFIGQAKKEEKKGLTQKEQSKILQEFRNKDFDVLVASSVAEEGLDIPSVDLVIFYEPVPSEIRTIQRRGRTGRIAKGKTIILITQKTRDEYYYYTSQSKEKKMHSNLKNISNQQKHQTILPKYVKKEEDILIYADTREQNTYVKEHLVEQGAIVKEKQLETADYILSSTIAVERKTVNDFASSLVDGRLFKQIETLQSSYQNPLMILEGNLEMLFESRKIHPNALRGALSSILLNYKLPIFFTSGPKETSQYLFTIAKREQIMKSKDVSLRSEKKPLTLQEQMEYIIQGFPNIGPKASKSLLSNLGSLESIFLSPQKELEKTELIGPKKAKEIYSLIRKPYLEPKEDKEN